MKRFLRTAGAVGAIVLGGSVVAQGTTSGTLSAPPVAKKLPVTDTYFGEKVTEDYRYMENSKDPYVANWFKGQAGYARSVLDRIPGRKALLDRIVELDSARTAQVSVPDFTNGVYFYRRRAANENIPRVYVRKGLKGEERLLIDPDAKNPPEGKHNAVDYFAPSDDGKLLAYGLSVGGSEDSVLHVCQTGDGKDLSESIDRARFGGVAWLPDGKSFFYNRLQSMTPDDPVTKKYLNSRVYLHKLGDDPEKDRAVLGTAVSPSAAMAPEDIPFVDLPPDSKYLFGIVEHGVLREITVYFAKLEDVLKAEDPATVQWTKLCDVPDAVTSYRVRGETIYLLTHKDAPRFKIVKMDLEKPDFAKAEVVMPEGERVISGINIAKDALYAVVRDGGVERLVRMGFETEKPADVALPVEGNVSLSADPREKGVLLGAGGWTQANLIYELDAETGKVSDTGLQPKGKFDVPGDVVSEEVFAAAGDGTKVPLSIVYKQGLKKDGSNVTWLTGYGAYGFSMDPGFSAVRLSWLERGGVMAFAHVRGGGEYGKEWHLAGKEKTKPNTWKDFIACGEYLVKEKYTSPEKLVGSGTSAGGILIGRAITDRPDLFAAACSDVGVSNALRGEFSANGVPNIPEFGTVKNEEGFKALREMDALDHVKDGVKYPAVLLVTGINDPRVDSWESGKMAARLQAATASGKPVLLRIDYDAGHGMGSTKMQRFEMLADQMAFFFWQAGVKEFQPGAAERKKP